MKNQLIHFKVAQTGNHKAEVEVGAEAGSGNFLIVGA
jgi:hypothetical protein